MKNNNKVSIGYKIKDLFTDDQSGTTPNENRLFIIGIMPAPFGITGGIMSLYLSIFPNDDKYSTLPGFILAIFFCWYVQLSMRRAFQMKDRACRMVLLEKMRIIPVISIGLAVVGLAITLLVWFFPPHNAPETFSVLAGMAIVFPVVGVLLTPFSFASRRISWLVNPR